MKERFQYRAEELHDRILKLDSTVMNVKLSYSKYISVSLK
jgi:hypothetical protein